MRTLGSDAPSSLTSLAPPKEGEEIMTTLGPKRLSQHKKELGVNRGMASGSVAGDADASGDENNAPVMKVCTFKSKESFSNFSASLSGDMQARNFL